jgi:hypothetical protein
MGKTPHRVTFKAVPGYALSHIGENEWKVLKIDPKDSKTILERYHIRGGQCECKGFAHRGDCRHVQMTLGGCDSVDKKTARAAATEIMNAWSDMFRRMLIDHYVEDPVKSDTEGKPLVKCVKLIANGRPLNCDGIDHNRIWGIHNKTLIEIDIEP